MLIYLKVKPNQRFDRIEKIPKDAGSGLAEWQIRLKAPAILLDFNDVQYIDSSGLATLVEFYKNSRSYSGRLAVAGLTDRVKSIFELVRLGEVFGVYPTVVEARDALLRN